VTACEIICVFATCDVLQRYALNDFIDFVSLRASTSTPAADYGDYPRLFFKGRTRYTGKVDNADCAATVRAVYRYFIRHSRRGYIQAMTLGTFHVGFSAGLCGCFWWSSKPKRNDVAWQLRYKIYTLIFTQSGVGLLFGMTRRAPSTSGWARWSTYRKVIRWWVTWSAELNHPHISPHVCYHGHY
jgi:hypothetical protein